MKKKQYKKPKAEYIQDDNYYPRKAAIKILAMNSRAEMEAELLKVPDKFRGWVKDYLNDFIAKRKIRRERGLM